MHSHYLPGKAEPDARTLRFGGVKWHKDFLHNAWFYTGAIIFYAQNYLAFFFVSTNDQVGGFDVFQGLHTVFYQVEQYLLHLVFICPYDLFR